jgi:hypothetical protein
MNQETSTNIDLSALIRKEIHFDGNYNLDNLNSSFEDACQKLIDFRNRKKELPTRPDILDDDLDEKSVKKN